MSAPSNPRSPSEHDTRASRVWLRSAENIANASTATHDLEKAIAYRVAMAQVHALLACATALDAIRGELEGGLTTSTYTMKP